MLLFLTSNLLRILEARHWTSRFLSTLVQRFWCSPRVLKRTLCCNKNLGSSRTTFPTKSKAVMLFDHSVDFQKLLDDNLVQLYKAQLHFKFFSCGTWFRFCVAFRYTCGGPALTIAACSCFTARRAIYLRRFHYCLSGLLYLLKWLTWNIYGSQCGSSLLIFSTLIFLKTPESQH